ncbi:hypothetical protein CMI37_12705 [Candidatus Pacearchaeota archaeon]|nr:hypothetical protein [Candidatus Pacearchaeota archaeon]
MLSLKTFKKNNFYIERWIGKKGLNYTENSGKSKANRDRRGSCKKFAFDRKSIGNNGYSRSKF